VQERRRRVCAREGECVEVRGGEGKGEGDGGRVGQMGQARERACKSKSEWVRERVTLALT